MVELFLIRHGKTYGNTLGRYIGTTDEELCAEGREALVRTDMGRTILTKPLDAVYVSPMKRCIQTAGLLFPDSRPIFCPELRECDFGEFENKNYGSFQEMQPIRHGLTAAERCFSGRREPGEFESRCLLGFGKVLEDIRDRCGSQKMRRKAAETKNQVRGGYLLPSGAGRTWRDYYEHSFCLCFSSGGFLPLADKKRRGLSRALGRDGQRRDLPV